MLHPKSSSIWTNTFPNCSLTSLLNISSAFFRRFHSRSLLRLTRAIATDTSPPITPMIVAHAVRTFIFTAHYPLWSKESKKTPTKTVLDWQAHERSFHLEQYALREACGDDTPRAVQISIIGLIPFFPLRLHPAGSASLLHEHHKSAGGDHHVETTLVGGDNSAPITHVLATIDGSITVEDLFPPGVGNG